MLCRPVFRPWRALFFVLIPFVVASPVLAGVVFEVETTDHSGSGPRVERSQLAVEGRALKVDVLAGREAAGQGQMIFRGASREMIIIDHDSRTYMVMDADAIARLGGQMSQAMSQMEKALANVPKEQRAMVEQMMKQRMPDAATTPKRPTAEYRNTGQRGTQQGYPCVRWDVFRDGEKTLELWVTDWDRIGGGGAEVTAVFNDMSEFYGELLAAFEKMAAGFGGAALSASGSPFEAFSQVRGFPVVTRSYKAGELDNETVLQSVTERTLDPAAFEPPKGYRLRTLGPQ